ncbi:MAG: hypothetical protein JXR58_10155 [Bacteroidales bacterium]|nr:hypothetical protein [Bacteroidales bacterium]
MKTCNTCLINENYPEITFDNSGKCSICSNYKTFRPLGEELLVKRLNKSKNKKLPYDVLVPLSGGKDSTFVLYLAVKVYKLRVLTMTYDNGFLSNIALDNIKKAVEICNVEHVFCKPNPDILKRIYRTMLLYSGDMCGACDIGTKANIFKIAADYKTPIILSGTSPLEQDSFVPDSIQDLKRFKYILNRYSDLSKKEINDFLIYPNLNNFSLSFFKFIGKFGREVKPLFYINDFEDKEIGNIIKHELCWKDDNREYSKHLDCVAEPFTNYIRNKIYGYERRLCQFSNMIRKGEISRDYAENLFEADSINSLPSNWKTIMDNLHIDYNDLDKILSNKPLKFEKNISKSNRVFEILVKMKRRLRN